MERYLRKYNEEEKGFRFRFLILVLLLVIGFLVVFLRLLYVNLFAEKILQEAEKYYKSVVSIRVPKYRGRIEDKEGITLAVSYPVGVVYITSFQNLEKNGEEKAVLKEKLERFVKKLSEISGIPEKELRKTIDENKDKNFFELAEIPYEKIDDVRALKRMIDYDEEKRSFTEPFLSSYVGVDFKYKRFYPHGNFASNLIGFIRKDGTGGEGLEFQFNELLTGSNRGWEKYYIYKDRKIKLVEPIYDFLNLPQDLRTSLDFRLQSAVEEIKKEIVGDWKPNRVIIIVMESATGKIRAYATYPDYDPNNYLEYFPDRTKNFGVAELYEPGSTFKPFLIAYALNKRIISYDTPIFINKGRMEINKKTLADISDYLRKRDYITPRELLAYSSNVGAARIGLSLKPENYLELLKIFHLNSTPGVLIGEQQPKLPDLRNEVNRAYLAIGQGISLNALHLLTSFNALIRGELVYPSVLESEEVKKEAINISPQVVNWIREALIDVVEKGTGKEAKSELFFVGGKTGTAQKYDPRLRRYSKTRLTTYFVGFFPKEPKFVAVILLDEPKGEGIFGGTVSAPYFKKLVEKTAILYNLKPDKK